MKLLIAGSRGITDFDLSKYITDDVDTILSDISKKFLYKYPQL